MTLGLNYLIHILFIYIQAICMEALSGYILSKRIFKYAAQPNNVYHSGPISSILRKYKWNSRIEPNSPYFSHNLDMVIDMFWADTRAQAFHGYCFWPRQDDDRGGTLVLQLPGWEVFKSMKPVWIAAGSDHQGYWLVAAVNCAPESLPGTFVPASGNVTVAG